MTYKQPTLKDWIFEQLQSKGYPNRPDLHLKILDLIVATGKEFLAVEKIIKEEKEKEKMINQKKYNQVTPSGVVSSLYDLIDELKLKDRFMAKFPDVKISGINDIPVEVAKTDTGIRVRAELPNVNREDVTLSLDKGNLVIKVEKKENRANKLLNNISYSDFYYGPMTRNVPVGNKIDQSFIRAAMANGVLTVELPVVKEEDKNKPLNIQIL
jgi:HSP20 family protein